MATYNTKNSRVYRAWANMKRRCKGSDAHNRRLYKDRGISVCEEWLEFKPFLAWAMSNGYRDDLTLDRIDPFADYSPENCRWVSYTVQNRHLSQRKSSLGERNIRKVSMNSYSVRFTKNGHEIHLGCYRTLEDAKYARDQWRAANGYFGG